MTSSSVAWYSGTHELFRAPMSRPQGDPLQCPRCGTELPSGAQSCPACGKRLADTPQQQSNGSGGELEQRRVAVYAGFWLRAIAYFLDSFLLGIPMEFVLSPLLKSNHVGTSVQDLWRFYSSGSRQAIAFSLLVQLFNWLWFAAFESSGWQATPGKRILGLRVTDLNGSRVSFARASGRFFGKYISVCTFLVGFLMAGYTQRKQALHDKIAKCLVVRAI